MAQGTQTGNSAHFHQIFSDRSEGVGLAEHPATIDGQLLTFGREEGRQDMH